MEENADEKDSYRNEDKRYAKCMAGTIDRMLMARRVLADPLLTAASAKHDNGSYTGSRLRTRPSSMNLLTHVFNQLDSLKPFLTHHHHSGRVTESVVQGCCAKITHCDNLSNCPGHLEGIKGILVPKRALVPVMLA